jgi:enoyl-[acyl-carrier-protein] reductase (NADH)
MAVVPGDVLFDHGLRRGVSGHVVDASLAHYKNLASISECFAIFGANSHDKPTGYEGMEANRGAPAVRFLLSDQPRYITGHVLFGDRGATLVGSSRASQ